MNPLSHESRLPGPLQSPILNELIFWTSCFARQWPSRPTWLAWLDWNRKYGSGSLLSNWFPLRWAESYSSEQSFWAIGLGLWAQSEGSLCAGSEPCDFAQLVWILDKSPYSCETWISFVSGYVGSSDQHSLVCPHFEVTTCSGNYWVFVWEVSLAVLAR